MRLVISLVLFAAFVHPVKAQEWQHNHPQFDPTGKVTLGTLSGVTSQLSNINQQGLQSSASPVILNISSIRKSVPDFAVSAGGSIVAFFAGAGFVEFTPTEFNHKYRYTSDTSVKSTAVTMAMTVSGTAAPGMSNICSPLRVDSNHPGQITNIETGVSPCSVAFRVDGLDYYSTHQIRCDVYTCEQAIRGDILLNGRSIASSIGIQQYFGSVDDLYGYELGMDTFHTIRFMYLDRIPNFYLVNTSVRLNPRTQSVFFAKHNNDTYWRMADMGGFNAVFFDISEQPILPPP